MNTTLTNSTELASWNFTVLPIFITSIHALNFFLSIPLNVYILVVLFCSKGVMEASDVFSWNQAISDMFFVLLGPFHSLCSINNKLCFSEALFFLLGISVFSRCLFQSCVCLERYLAVVHPVTFLRYKPLRYRVACSITTWMCSLAIGFTWSCTFPNTPYDVFCVIYLLILTVDFFCCMSILRKLRHPGPRDMESDAREMNVAKKKAFQVVSFNLLAFLIQNIPILVTYGTKNILSDYAFNIYGTISLAINIFTEFWQPVYVLHRAGKLPLIQFTPFSTCCISSGPTKPAQHTVAL